MSGKNKTYENWDNFIVEEFRNNPRFASYSLKRALKAYEKEGDIHMLLIALRHVAEAKGISYVARKANISRAAIYKCLSMKGNPTITSLQHILKALGYTFHFKPL